MKSDNQSDSNEDSGELHFPKGESNKSDCEDVANSNEGNKAAKPVPEEALTPGRRNLQKWLGKPFRVVITDGRVLVGFFNCTDKDANLVLSMCAEYLEKEGKDPRILGNVMVPGKHIVSISVDEPSEETVT